MRREIFHKIRSRIGEFRMLMGSGLIIILALAVAWTKGGHEGWRGSEGATAQPDRAARAAHAHTSQSGRRPFTARHTRVNRAPRSPDRLQAVVQVSPRRVLARVNGKPIRLEHLVPLKPGGEALAMKNGVFRSRLRRAIEAELVFQEASERGIGLSKRQQARLDRIAPRHKDNLVGLNLYGISWDSLSEEQISLERRLMEATMLRQNLVAAETGAAPSPDRKEQALFENALHMMLTQLEARADIDLP